MIKPGTHNVKFIGYVFAEPDEEGKSPFVALSFETLDEPKQLGTYKRYLSTNAAEYTFADLNRLGIDADGTFDTNNEFSIVLEEEEYNGKMITKLRWINNVSKFKKMDPTKLGGVLKNYSSYLKRNPSQTKPILKRASNSDFSPGEDFDITAG